MGGGAGGAGPPQLSSGCHGDGEACRGLVGATQALLLLFPLAVLRGHSRSQGGVNCHIRVRQGRVGGEPGQPRGCCFTERRTGLNLSRLTWNFVLALSLIFCVNLMNSLPAPGFSFLTRRALGCNVIQSRGAFAGGRASSLTFILCPFCKARGILRFQRSRANGVIPLSMH